MISNENVEIKEILDLKEDADYKRLSIDEITILRDYITNLQEENQRLKIIKEKDKEIESLNNIINELEDLIVIKLQRDYHEHNYRISTGDLEEIYDKLQELKGDSSNE